MEQQQLTTEEKQILALVQKLKTTSQASINIKKLVQTLRASRKLLDQAIETLTGELSEQSSEQEKAVDPEAPHGRKMDGTPKKAPGRATKAKPVE